MDPQLDRRRARNAGDQSRGSKETGRTARRCHHHRDICLASQLAGANFYKYDTGGSRGPAHVDTCMQNDAFAARIRCANPARRNRCEHPVPLNVVTHETCKLQSNGRASYGAVTGSGIIDLGRKLSKYPTLLDLLRAGAISDARAAATGPADLGRKT